MVPSVNSIPILDLTQQYATIEAEVSDAVLRVLASGGYIGGSQVLGFEQQFAAYIGVSNCVVCNSGTDALVLALRALEIGPGDEVITTPFTFFATAEVVSAVGAKPVFVDVDAQTFNLDIAQVETAITDKTKAVIPVHLFGQPVDMTALMAIAQAHQLAVIEDCAQSTGALWAGQKVGSIGHIGCFSFYPTKNLGACGDGGAVTTNDQAIAAKIRILRSHGEKSHYHHEEIGLNSRLDALQAAILQIKLRYLDTWNEKRRRSPLVTASYSVIFLESSHPRKYLAVREFGINTLFVFTEARLGTTGISWAKCCKSGALVQWSTTHALYTYNQSIKIWAINWVNFQ